MDFPSAINHWSPRALKYLPGRAALEGALGRGSEQVTGGGDSGNEASYLRKRSPERRAAQGCSESRIHPGPQGRGGYQLSQSVSPVLGADTKWHLLRETFLSLRSSKIAPSTLCHIIPLTPFLAYKVEFIYSTVH